MPSPVSTQIAECVREAQALFHRLVLVVGEAGTGKTAALTALVASNGWPRINVNLQMAEQLLDLTQKQRAIHAAAILEDLVAAAGADVAMLDNIEILFAVELAQDPLRLLYGLSRNRVIVATWPGIYDGQTLSYAVSGHREHRTYLKPEALIVSADASPLSQEESRREI